MNATLSDEYTNLVRYFLGELSAAEQEFVEERYILDQQYSDLRDEVEMDLVDAYVASTLTPLQRRHFERHYLITAERHEAVRAAYLTKAYRESLASAAARPAPPAWKGAPGWRVEHRAFVTAIMAALTIAIIGVGALLMTLRRAPKSPMTPVLTARNQPQPAPHRPAVPPAVKSGPGLIEAPVPRHPAVTTTAHGPATAGSVHAATPTRIPSAGNQPQPPPSAEAPVLSQQAAGSTVHSAPANGSHADSESRVLTAGNQPQLPPAAEASAPAGTRPSPANPPRVSPSPDLPTTGTDATNSINPTVANSPTVDNGTSVYLEPIQKRLEAAYKLTKTNYDKTDIVAAGSAVVLQKDKLLMLAASSTNPCRNTYRDGQIRQSGPCATNEKLKRFSKLTSRIPGSSSVPDSPSSHTFVTGEKFWVTKIEVRATGKDPGIVFNFFTDEIGDDKTRFATSLLIPFGAFTPTPEQALKLVQEVITVVPAEDVKADAKSDHQQPAQSAPEEPAPAAIEPPPPPPADPAPTPTVSLGQSTDEVKATLGPPLRVTLIGTKTIYTYKDLKVTFVNGKVQDVQ